jgi:hypothetical protein
MMHSDASLLLNVAIAERVLYWEIQWVITPTHERLPMITDEEGKQVSLPNFGLSMNDAWIIVREMRERGLGLMFDADDEMCMVSFVSAGEVVGHGEAEADQEPLAICLAAFDVVGISVEHADDIVPGTEEDEEDDK